jgi:hypothetical protein
VAEPGRELPLEGQRLGVVALEQGDEQGQDQEVVRAHLEQRDVVVGGQRLPFGVGEPQPGAALGARAVEDSVGLLGLPPGHGAARVGAVALDQFRVPVDGVQELVQQVLAHCAATPFGYQVK